MRTSLRTRLRALGSQMLHWLDDTGRGDEPYLNPRRITDPLAPWLPWIGFDDDSGMFLLEDQTPDAIEAIGFALELRPQTGANEQMWAMLQTLFSMAPRSGMSIQVQMFGSPNLDSYIGAYVRAGQGRVARSETERQALELSAEATRRRVEYFRRGTAESPAGSLPFRFRQFRLVFSATMPVSGVDDEAAFAAMASYRDAAVRTFQSFWMAATPMAPQELIAWVVQLVNPSWLFAGQLPDLGYRPAEELRDQMQLPGAEIRVRRDRLEFSGGDGPDVALRALTVARYPDEPTLAMMARAIGDPRHSMTGYPCPFIVSFGARTVDFADARATTMLRAARAAQAAETPLARWMPEWKDKHRDWQLMAEASNAGIGSVHVGLDVIVFARPDHISDATQAAQNVWRQMAFDMVPNSTAHLSSLIAALPMSLTAGVQEPLRARRRLKLMTVANAADLMPVLAESTGCGQPVLSLYGRCGQAQGYDLFAPSATNYNLAIAANSGSGKTFTANEILWREWQRGTKCIVIDIGRNYERLCRNCGGQYIDCSPDSELTFDPFSGVDDIEEHISLIVPLLAQMASPSRRLTDYEVAQLNIIVRMVWEDARDKGQRATVTDVANALKKACAQGGTKASLEATECDPRLRDLGVQLFNFTQDGAYGRFFVGDNSVDFASDFIVLDLQNLRQWPDLQQVVLLMVMQQINKYAYRHRTQRKMVLIDEAWKLLDGGNTAAYIEEGYRIIRRYNGSFGTITQKWSDYLKSDASRAAYACSYWRISLQQPKDVIAAMIKSGDMVLDEAQRAAIESVQTIPGVYSEMMVIHGDQWSVGRLLVDPYSLLRNSSAPEDMNAIDAYMTAGLSQHAAILQVLADRGWEQGTPRRRRGDVVSLRGQTT
ncbi:MAG: type IV secretion system protein TraC [Rhodocyclaceae bacterium]|nr:type IV secretion system protein TraC [Rhodocyclaceae bacterium]